MADSQDGSQNLREGGLKGEEDPKDGESAKGEDDPKDGESAKGGPKDGESHKRKGGIKDEGGKRYGDWQKRSLREDANRIVGEPDLKPWYQQDFWLIVLILVFWPVGLYLAWKGDWPLWAKILASVAVVFCIAGMVWVRLQTPQA